MRPICLPQIVVVIIPIDDDALTLLTAPDMYVCDASFEFDVFSKEFNTKIVEMGKMMKIN